MLRRVRLILEMIKFSHTLFALPFALLAALLAWSTSARDDPPVPWRWQELAGILLCMVFARSLALAVNRVADRRFDAANPRTAARHIPAGLVGAPAVLLFSAACGTAFVASTLLFWPNWLPLALSLPILAFLVGYSFAKRFTALAHFWLGAALMLAPVSSWIAVRGLMVIETPADLIPAATLGAAVLLWVGGFDIIYACQDAAFDAAAGLKSLPARLGIASALRLAALCHLGMIAVLALLPLAAPRLGLGWVYGLGVAAVAALLAYEHALVPSDDLTRVNTAFFHVNGVVSAGLLVVTAIDLWT
jgi:4-hydroxybenzoate polyprenyltransferase